MLAKSVKEFLSLRLSLALDVFLLWVMNKSGFKIILVFQLMEFHLDPQCFHRADIAGSLHVCTYKYSCRCRHRYDQTTEVVISGE